MLALLTASIMLVTIFSAISVNAEVKSNTNVKLIDDGSSNLDGMEATETNVDIGRVAESLPDLIPGIKKQFVDGVDGKEWWVCTTVKNVGSGVAGPPIPGKVIIEIIF